MDEQFHEEIENAPSDMEDILALMNGEPDDDENGDVDENDPDEDNVPDEGTDDDTDNDEDDEGNPDEDDDEGDDDPDEDENDDEDGEEGDEDDFVEAADDHVVKVTVNGEEQSVKVSDLKRLAGQEAALTQKAQVASQQRRALESQSLYFSQMMAKRYEAAQAKAAKYKDVDLYQASRELDDEDFNALRSAKEGADAELATIEAEARDFIKTSNESRQSFLREQAKEARKVLMEQIPEWDDNLYSSIRSYAVKQGMDSTAVNEIVDPAAILMIHKALKFDEAQQKAATVEKKVRKAPKRSARKAANKTDNKGNRMKALKRRASSEGDIDAITALMDELS